MLSSRNPWLAFVLLVISGPTGIAEEPKLPAGKTCQGTLVLGSKTYRLEHAVVYEAKVFDQPGLTVLLAERAIPVDKLKAALAKGAGKDDDFSYFEPHAKINFSAEGKPMYFNAYGDGHSLSVSGSKLLEGTVNVKDGKADGKTTLDTGDEGKRKRVLDARFACLLIALPAAAAPATPDVAKLPPGKAGGPKAPAAGAMPSVRDLPLPADATAIEKKKLVEQLSFQSPANVTTLTSWLSKQYASRGWKREDGDDDLVTPKSAILKRLRGGAEITVFVKPNGTGSKVTIMTSGLSWDEPTK